MVPLAARLAARFKVPNAAHEPERALLRFHEVSPDALDGTGEAPLDAQGGAGGRCVVVHLGVLFCAAVIAPDINPNRLMKQARHSAGIFESRMTFAHFAVSF